ncbi:hypothetical protein C435_03243 [Haloarcula marismortui ATCC 33799]|uniref:Uncharacterized protein n=1 Tax=Haloarcula marismortui ATCC 33799 TaxID=662475 RepID=M0KYL7_9EURY|nr:hypothetical protein C435_03243 [Haloarcula californiae ATCC 33799]
MCGTNPPPENWDAEPINEDSLPKEISIDDAPIAWRNIHDDKVICVRPNPREDHEWAVAGPNSIIRSAESLEEAKEKARSYMQSTRRPSSMV